MADIVAQQALETKPDAPRKLVSSHLRTNQEYVMLLRLTIDWGRTMRFRKTITGVLVVASLTISAPAFADSRAGFGPDALLYAVSIAALALSAAALADASRSP